MSIYGNQLVERIQRGVKVAFAASITQMLERALWIVGLAVADRAVHSGSAAALADDADCLTAAD